MVVSFIVAAVLVLVAVVVVVVVVVALTVNHSGYSGLEGFW